MSYHSSPCDLAREITELAADRRALDIVVLDLRGLSSVTDYFVICTGRSGVQVQAICEHVERELKERGRTASAREGVANGQWALLDYADVVVHVFQPQTRELYDLERLWFEAPRWTYPEGSAIEVSGT